MRSGDVRLKSGEKGGRMIDTKKMSKAKRVNSEISDFKVLKVLFPTGGNGNKVSE